MLQLMRGRWALIALTLLQLSYAVLLASKALLLSSQKGCSLKKRIPAGIDVPRPQQGPKGKSLAEGTAPRRSANGRTNKKLLKA